jgi:hypothetical protein
MRSEILKIDKYILDALTSASTRSPLAFSATSAAYQLVSAHLAPLQQDLDGFGLSVQSVARTVSPFGFTAFGSHRFWKEQAASLTSQ